jgi:hypothetical protein
MNLPGNASDDKELAGRRVLVTGVYLKGGLIVRELATTAQSRRR